MRWEAVAALGGVVAIGTVAAVILRPRRRRAAGPLGKRLARAVAARLNENGKAPDQQWLEHVAQLIVDDAALRGHDPLEYASFAWIESRFKPYAVSSSGAEGLFQQKPWYAAPDPVECLGRLVEDEEFQVWSMGNKWDDKTARWDSIRDAVQAYHDGDGGCCEPGYPYATAWQRAYDALVEFMRQDQRSPLQVEWGAYPFDERESWLSGHIERVYVRPNCIS